MTRAIDCAYSLEGSGPPLFLIHGIGAARDTWRFAMPELTRHFTVISYDLRGHGASPAGEGAFGLDDLVADLERLRRRLGFDRAHFAGHSLGGMIAPAYARDYPHRVLSLALLSTAAGRTQQDTANVRAVVHAMEEKGIREVLPTLTGRWFTDGFLANSPDIVQRRLDQVTAMPPEIFLNVFRIYAQTEMLPWLHQIKAPCLVLSGENDGGCSPRLNRLIAAELDNAELVILPRLKHSILLEDGATVARHIVRFVHGMEAR